MTSHNYIRIDGIEYHKRFIDRWARLVLEYQKKYGSIKTDDIVREIFGTGGLQHQIAIRVWEIMLYGDAG